jgi:hypothetical protein
MTVSVRGRILHQWQEPVNRNHNRQQVQGRNIRNRQRGPVLRIRSQRLVLVLNIRSQPQVQEPQVLHNRAF